MRTFLSWRTLQADDMSNKYAHAAERARRFFVSVSVETDALNAKINAYGDGWEGLKVSFSAEKE